MRIIVEKNVPFTEALDGVAEVRRLPHAEITADAVRDADALVVRTRNRCNEVLLGGSKVRLVATATIGTDHIDLGWCRANGIEVANAPGSNAPAVAQYVFSSLVRVVNRPLSSYRLGIVGVGHVGSIVERWARAMSMPVMLCDPPRQAAEGCDCWHSLDDLCEWADIITFHTPLTTEGQWPTHHLAGKEFFSKLRRAPIIINSSRGAVADNAAWAEAIEAGECGQAIIDCWEGEPDLNPSLLEKAAIATPHIAGYSIEGKRRASQMALDAISACFGLAHIPVSGEAPKPCASTITPAEALRSYDPTVESAALKANPEAFEALRNNYKLRHEPNDTPVR